MTTRNHDEGQFEQLIEELSHLSSYTIGRSTNNAIVLSNSRISGQHARLIQCTPDSFLLEDLGSKNGTFVNGTRLTRKVVDRTTTLELADIPFTVEQLLDFQKPEPPENPDTIPQVQSRPVSSPEATQNLLDFTIQFAELKRVFEQYPTLRKDCRNREKMVRTGSIILSSIIGVSSVLATGGSALPLLQIMSGAGLSMLLPTLCSTLLSTEEKIEIIDKEYRERYRCPNPTCRDPFGTREWDFLAKQKTCRRCQAIWIK
jgi:hypothetical protein